MSKVGSWSIDAATNTAASPDGLPEGMAPSGVNDAAREMMARIKEYANDAEWFDRALTPTYVSANAFTVVGDQTGFLQAGRALKLYDTSGTAQPIYRFIRTASFTVVTTLQLESGTAITSSLTSFAIAALAAPGQIRSQPQNPVVLAELGANQSVTGSGTPVLFTTIESNTLSWYSVATGAFTPQWPGWYQIQAQCEDNSGLATGGNARLIALRNNLTAVGALGPIVEVSAGEAYSTYLGTALPFNGSSDTVTVTHYGVNGRYTGSRSWLAIYYLGK